ncbi:MAG: hypothetical protein HZA01_01895 [Nitrospinae bacterium]|nr:hypothetical protein [Nitrospinota bacterium]
MSFGINAYAGDGQIDSTSTSRLGSKSTIKITIVDKCNDGYEIDYRFYDTTNNLVWPSSSAYYYTQKYAKRYVSTLLCQTGATVCYGGNTGNLLSWGVGIDYTESCSDCCVICRKGVNITRNLTCF